MDYINNNSTYNTNTYINKSNYDNYKNENYISNYYIALIIITIIGFTLSIILSFYFVYLPAQRSSSAFDDLYQRGTEVVDNAVSIADDVNETAMVTSDFLVSLCTGIENDEGQLGGLKDSFGETCKFILDSNDSV